MANKITIPDLDPSADLAVLKSNITFSGTFTTSSGTITINYGDGTSETTNTPSHTYTGRPPYLINISKVDRDLVTGITMDSNSLTAVDVSRFKNLTTLDVSNNLLPRREVSKLLVDLDNSGQENGTLNNEGNLFDTDLTTDAVNAYYSLIVKGWTLYGLGWSPALISTTAWYDTSDASTIIESSGLVSQLDDKSGTLNHLIQGNGANQPVTNSRSLNTLNVLDFNGSKLLEHLSFNLPSSNVAIFIVAGVDSVDNGFNSLISMNAANKDFQYASQADPPIDTDFYGRMSTSGLGGSNPSDSIGGPFNGPSIYNLNFDFGLSLRNVFVDGSQTNANNDYTTGISTPNDLRIMSNRSGTKNMDGIFAECIIIDGVSDTVRQQAEGYLAHKWGLTANLPVLHPYKTLSP
jgi:hypothetical protein